MNGHEATFTELHPLFLLLLHKKKNIQMSAKREMLVTISAFNCSKANNPVAFWLVAIQGHQTTASKNREQRPPKIILSAPSLLLHQLH